MIDKDDPLTRAWVENWLRVGPKLEAIRRRELQEMSEAERMRIADELLQIGCRFARPRPTSGLVEQQRLFQKARDPSRRKPE